MSSTIDAKEIDLIRKFRNRVTDVVSQEKLQNDHFLVRWLRARDYDLEKAEAMLRKSMAWHRRNETDTILAWKPVQNYYRYAMLGHDAEGCPVFILPVGYMDFREAAEAGDIVPAFRAILRTLIRMQHEVDLAQQPSSKSLTQVNLIIDFQEFSSRQLNNRTVVQGLLEFLRIFEANFPEILKSCIFINTSRIFSMFFTIIKPFLSNRTKNKMEFFGEQQSKWGPVLLSKIPSEIIPPYYGGTRIGSDEFCSDSEIWNDDEPLPKNFFSTNPELRRNSVEINGYNGEGSQNGCGNFKCEEIPAGSKVELDYPVSLKSASPSILLKWKIKSLKYDVGFQVTFRHEGEKVKHDLIEPRRLDSHLTIIEGSLVCDRSGTYTLILDNSYSKRTKKTVLYNVSLVELEI